MTTEEAIKILDDGNWWDYLDCHIPKETRMELIDALYFADVALCAQQERENPKPLTLDELREMDGEPVLLETGEVFYREQLIAEWEILTEHDEDAFFFTRRKRGFLSKNYGITWLAYRHKLKGGSKC